MHALRLFGGASIEDLEGDSAVPRRARQRHRLALLALLAVESRELSRDKLIGYLWPESDGKQARNLLSVSLYVLRGALGEDTLLSRGDDVRLNDERIRTDVVEFEAAMERGDHAAAVELYEGPFLDGFFLPNAHEFERWADRQRERLSGAYARALEALACAAEAAGDAPEAVTWWKRRVACDRFDSRVTARLMKALESAGNRAGAIELAETHATLLREEFGTEPTPEVTELAARLRDATTAAAPSRDADPRPTKPAVTPSEPDDAGPSSATPSSATPSPEPRPADSRAPAVRRATARWLVAALLGIAVLAGAFWAESPFRSAPDRSIVVLPFASLGPQERGEFFADGVTEEIISHLSAVPDLKVISRTSSMRYEATDRPLEEIAEELGVAHVLEGSVRHVGASVRISVQLIEASSGYHTWSSVYDGELVDIFGLQRKIAQAVVDTLAPRLGARGSVSPARRGTRDPEALEMFLRGRHHWLLRTPEGHERAREYFRRALERDSTYADAYAGLAYTYMTGYQLGFTDIPEADVYAQVKWAAERALALDDSSPDAHVAHAMALWWQWNWPGTERHLRRALELNPGHVTARTWYALLLGGWGRLDEALREAERAHDVDPFAVVTSTNFAQALYHAGRYDRALEQARKTMELDGAWGLPIAAHSHVQSGELQRATRVLRDGLETYTDRAAIPAHLGEEEILADLAYVRARAGDRAEAVSLLGRARQRGAEPFHIARAYVALQQPDSAFAWLRRAPWQWPHRANRYDPALDPLREDPRFAELSTEIDRELGIR